MRIRARHLLIFSLAPLAVLAAALIWGRQQARPVGFAPTVSGEAPAAATLAGPVTYTVDARSREAWVFFDFAAGTIVETSFDGAGWDIALRRTELRTNGGVTNPRGNVAVANLGDVALETAAIPADTAFASDQLGGDDGDQVVNEAIPKWHRYNLLAHIVSAREATYLIRTNAGRDVLVRFDSYYCEDGSPGCVTFRYLAVR